MPSLTNNSGGVSHEEKEEEGATPQLSPLRCRGQWDHGAGNRYGRWGPIRGSGGRRPTGREGQVKREGLLPLPRAPDENSLPPLARFEHFHFALLDSLKPDKHGINDLTRLVLTKFRVGNERDQANG